jgi:DNA-directed RNA polymerase subunit RPC12/RpoP
MEEDDRIFVCLDCGEEFKYKQGDVGPCPFCGGQLAVDTKTTDAEEKKEIK